MYKKLQDIPEDDKFLIKRLLDLGVIDVNSKKEFYISKDMLEILKILARCGIL